MKIPALLIFGCVVAAQPAFADRLTVAEVYRRLQGDWGRTPEGASDEAPCQSTVRRFSLDTDGYGLTIQDVRRDGSVVRHYKYRLSEVPSEDSKAAYLEFLGSEVDRSKDALVWRDLLSISMTDVDHLHVYFGYASWGDTRPGYVEIVPHGFGGDMIRCR